MPHRVVEEKGLVLIVLLNELDGALRKDVAVVRRVAPVAWLCLVPAVGAVAVDAPARRLRKVVLHNGIDMVVVGNADVEISVRWSAEEQNLPRRRRGSRAMCQSRGRRACTLACRGPGATCRCGRRRSWPFSASLASWCNLDLCQPGATYVRGRDDKILG